MAFLAMIVVVLLVLVSAPISSRAAQEAVRANLEGRPGAQGITPEMQEQAARMVTNPLFTLVLPIAGGLVGLWVSWLVWAGGLHLASTVLGGSSSFRQMFQAVVWSWLPFTLRRLLQIIYIAATQKVIANPGLSGWVASSQAAAGPGGSGLVAAPTSTGVMVLRAFLAQVDVFLLWSLLLVVLAVLVTARVSVRKAAGIVLVVWLLFTAVGMLPTLVASIASGSFSP
jgi:hypothetical protein